MGKANTLFQIPRVTVTVGVALALLSAIIAVIYYTVPDAYKGAIIVFGTGLAASGAIAGAIYMGRTLTLYIESEARNTEEVTFRFTERWNDPQMFHSRDVCRQIMDMKDKPEHERKKELNDNENLRKNVRPVLNFLEELALAVRIERTDSDLSKRMFAGIVISVYHVAEPWIKDQRLTRNRPQLWSELEWLYRKWTET